MVLTKLILLFVILSWMNFDASQAWFQPKNIFLKKYSIVEMNRIDNAHMHRRIKRSLDKTLDLSFDTQDRSFSLRLTPVESEHQYIEIDDRKVPASNYLTYEGVLVDEPNDSQVTGAIIDGSFVGTIRSKRSGVFHVEPAVRFDDSFDHSKSIVYHENDVETNPEVIRAKRNAEEDNEQPASNGISCGATKRSIIDRIEQIQKNAKPTGPSVEHRRAKRQSTNFRGNDTCFMYLKVDSILYSTIYAKEGNKNDDSTVAYLLLYIQNQMNALNSFYRSISSYASSGDATFASYIRFKQSRIKIYTPALCTTGSLSDAEKQICPSGLDQVTFLNNLSADDYSNYCLMFAFTARDFADGTYGLAFLGSTNGNVGGACQKPVTVNGKVQSLNSGMVTLVSYNQRIPQAVNEITFAHEVGHALGSTHDNSSQCTPGGTAGNYIMFSRATTGLATNNKRFSTCSLSLINSFLNFLVNSQRNCLKTFTSAICGNGVIESGEQCDSGSSTGNGCCTSSCQLNTAAGCLCDPSQGLCCDPTTKRFKTSGTVCQASGSCLNDIRCTGTSAVCPNATSGSFKSDGTLCNGNSQVCQSGVCSGSICSRVAGLTQCYLPGNFSDPSINKTRMCRVACTGTATNNVCTDVSQLAQFNYTIIQLQPGSPCANLQGYCDIFAVCRSFDADAQLSKLAQTLLAPTSITWSDIKTWAQTYWWAILIFSILFVLVNALIIICIHRHTSSDNPEKTLRLRFKDTVKSPFNVFRSSTNVHYNKRQEMRRQLIAPSKRPQQVTREIMPDSNYFNRYMSPTPQMQNSEQDLRTISGLSARPPPVSRTNKNKTRRLVRGYE